jgi:hypothetical protein
MQKMNVRGTAQVKVFWDPNTDHPQAPCRAKGAWIVEVSDEDSVIQQFVSQGEPTIREPSIDLIKAKIKEAQDAT